MGLFDKIKKAVSGGSAAPAAKPSGGQGGNRQGGQGGNRSGGNRQGGNRQNQGGNRQGGQGGQGGSGEGSGQGGNRRRGSRGGRGRGGQGQGGTQTQERQGQGQGGNRQGNRNQQGGNRQGGNRNQGEGRDAQNAEGSSTGQSSNARRRRRGGRGRGSGSGGGNQQGGTRTVTRSDAAELKEQQEKSGETKSSSSRRRSRGGRSGSNRSGSGRGRERTRRGSSSSGSHRRVLDANERPKNPVKKQILINAQDPNEIRVAIREQQQVVEVYVERKGKRSLAGNIYKGRVQNVLPGMEACFVDVGLERNGFLYVDEITPAAADSDQVMKVGMVTEVEAGNSPEDVMEDAATTHGEIAEGETLEMADAMAEEDAEQAAANAGADEATDGEGDAAKKDGGAKGRGRARIRNKQKIQDLLKQGQEILVQVVKDPMGTKGSRLTTQYSLAGRYLVFVPDGEGLGVSRRLEDAERNRLREIVKQFELPWGGGLIVRTAAEGARDEDIAKDLDLLLRLHEQLMEKAGDARAPKLLYNEADLSLRIIRDLFNGEVEEVLVDDERQFQRITNYLKRTSPELAERVRMHDGQRPLFESYGVDEAIKSTLSKRADLPSGGYLILDKTEAFHVIDVNSGRNVGKASLEETITKTNMEAAAEVVRQLRLRDLGGIIVIDFIDMNQMKNRDAVLEHFRTELSKDRTKTYLVEISPLGLVEMTRQNVSEGVREILTSTCRTCEGRGVQISPETHAIEVERALIDLAAGLGSDVEAVAVDAQPDVAKALTGNQSKQAELDKRAGKHIRVLADPDLTPNTFALRATGSLAEVEAAPEPLLRGSKHKVLIEKVDPSCEQDGIANIGGIMVTVIGAAASVGEEKTIVIAACSGTRAFATLVKPARRRRRRGGRGRKKATVGVGAAGAAGAEAEELQSDVDAESGDEAEGDEEFEEFEDEEIVDDAAAEAEEIDDERTEIPQRLVLLDEDEEAEDDDEDEEDEDDVDGSDPDESDDASDDSDDDSDSSSDEDSSDDDDDDDPSGGSSSADVDEESDGDDDSEDEDSHLDPTSAVDAADDAKPLAVRRESTDDRDEPSIDADGSDSMLAERGVTAIKTASVSVGNGTAPQAGAAPALGPDGQPRKRRRRGSRGGRNRNRSGANGQNRSAASGSAGSGGDGSSSSSQGSAPTSNSDS